LEAHLKPNVNLKTLTLNMENVSSRDTGDLSLKQLSIHIQLTCGPTGEWSIQNASIGDSQPTKATNEPHQHFVAPNVNIGIGSRGPSMSSGTTYIQPKPKPIPILRPNNFRQPTPTSRPNKIWQPRKIQPVVTGPAESTGLNAGKTKNSRTLVISDTTVPQVSLSTGDAKCPDAEALWAEINRTWGSSSDWVLQLRDGKRVSIPLSLIQNPTVEEDHLPYSSDEPRVLLLEGFNDMGSCDSRFDEDEDEENISMV
jgi:hypothetical protein